MCERFNQTVAYETISAFRAGTVCPSGEPEILGRPLATLGR
jgi:hypothetical protein